MTIARVGELVIGSRKLLETLSSDIGEIAGEFRVFREDHRPSRNKTVDQRLLPHDITQRTFVFSVAGDHHHRVAGEKNSTEEA